MIKTKYITKDEFKAYTGIDLDLELKDDDNPSDKANAFLRRIEVRLATFIDAKFARQVDREYPTLSDYQKEHYKYALLEQALYVLKNSDLITDSGYDPEVGEVARQERLELISVSSQTKQHLILCGMWNRKLKARSGGWFL